MFAFPAWRHSVRYFFSNSSTVETTRSVSLLTSALMDRSLPADADPSRTLRVFYRFKRPKPVLGDQETPRKNTLWPQQATRRKSRTATNMRRIDKEMRQALWQSKRNSAKEKGPYWGPNRDLPSAHRFKFRARFSVIAVTQR